MEEASVATQTQTEETATDSPNALHDRHCPEDQRACYDVLSYDVELDFTASGGRFTGEVSLDFVVLHEGMQSLVLDAGDNLRMRTGRIKRKELGRRRVTLQHKDAQVSLQLEQPMKRGERANLKLRYEGKIREPGSDAWLTQTMDSGSIRFDTSLQYAGAHHVFPCKASYFHPEDTPQHSRLRLQVPGGLRAIGPGKRTTQKPQKDGSQIFQFELPHPTPTWALGFAFGPYALTSMKIDRGAQAPQRIEVYRIDPSNPGSQRLIHELPTLLKQLEQTFGPYPFPDFPLSVVETLNQSTANAGWTGLSSMLFAPESPEVQGEEAEYTFQHARRILSHELGHAWWGHGLSVRSWEDIWLHESFAAYGELACIEATYGRSRYEMAYHNLSINISPKARLAMRGRACRSAHNASQPVLWFKGPWVLRTLGHELGGQKQLHAVLAEFQKDFRFQAVSTGDLVGLLNSKGERQWDTFFAEWFTGRSSPRLSGVVEVHPDHLQIQIDNLKDRVRSFHVSIDLHWTEGEEHHSKRVMLKPGLNEIRLPARAPSEVSVTGLDEVLCWHEIKIVSGQ